MVDEPLAIINQLDAPAILLICVKEIPADDIVGNNNNNNNGNNENYSKECEIVPL